jgi:hypothetical protein
MMAMSGETGHIGPPLTPISVTPCSAERWDRVSRFAALTALTIVRVAGYRSVIVALQFSL